MNIRKLLHASAIGTATILMACTEMADRSTYDTSSASAPPARYCCASARASMPQSAYWDEGRESYPQFEDNPVRQVAEAPVSTFSIDVDTASYARMRRFLNDGLLPPPDAVRTEELVNYFPYDYRPPASREQPFRAETALFDAPWDEGRQLLRIGIKGFDIPAVNRPPANLVFLIDTSGSMHSPDKLPLVQRSLRMLVDEIGAEDRIALVTYAGSAGILLRPAKGIDTLSILTAIDGLRAGGSTAGGAGIELAYRLARENYRDGAVNRVILATDGDFNVGISDPDRLEALIASKRRSGIYLSVLGFGTGNLKDATMQRLAQAGNGNAAYIDSFQEARKVLVDELGSTLFPIADDVKVQIEFNPAHVAEYRLIGYETRMLRREDFNNDRIDAGEVGSGHTVTALYEIVAPDSPARRVDPLRYAEEAPQEPAGAANGELAWLRIRYKLPGDSKSRLIEQPVLAAARTTFAAAPQDARFAAAVAGFGQLLRNSDMIGDFDWNDVLGIAHDAKGEDILGYRAEFNRLVGTAAGLARLAAAQ
ncbi:MAG: VWA domain-containing protein [Rhodospirillales bacterium]|nr:MAG: VWA domain-containing protein [Rhodospirillales bacterium]